MSTIIDFKPYRRLLFDNTNYYLLNDFGNEVELEMVRKREVGKLVKVDKLGRWVVQADNPDLETLKYVLIDNVTPVHFTLTEEGFANGADVIVVPNPLIPQDQPGTMKVKYPVEVNFDATENRHYEIKPEDPDTQIMEKVNLSVGVKKNFYLNKDEVPPELQVIIIENPDEEEGGSILHKKIIDKEVTITTNGDTTLTPDANEVYNIVKIHTMIPQSITIDPSQIPEDKTVIVVENEEGDEHQTQIISKEWEHKEIEITENGETVVEATEGKVLRDVTITTNVPQEVTIESSETGRKPGYDIIYVPYLDEEGHIDPTHESDPVFKKGVEKVRTITTNHSTTEITPSSNEILNKVTIKVEVPQTQEYVFGDNNIIEGHDTIVIPKRPDDTSDPTIRSVNWETVNKEFKHNIENYEITATSNEYILDKVNVKVNVPMQDKTVTITHNGEVTIEPDENYDAMTSTTINVNVPIEGYLEEKEVELTKEDISTSSSTLTKEILPSEGNDAMTKVVMSFNQSIFRDGYKIRPVETTIYGETGQFIIGDALFYNMAESPSSATGGVPRPYSFRSHDRNWALTGALHKTVSISRLSENEAVITDYDLGHTMDGVSGVPKHNFIFAVIRDNRFAIWLFIPNQSDSAYSATRTSGNTRFYEYTWTQRDKRYENYKGVIGWATGFTTSGGKYDGVDASDIINEYKSPSTPISWTPGFPRLHLISSSFMVDVMQESTSLRTAFIGCDTPLDSTYSDIMTKGYVGTLRYNGDNTSSYDVIEIATGHDILDDVSY